MFEKIKQHKTEIAIVSIAVGLVAVGGVASYVMTRNHYLAAIYKMNLTAHKAGVLETLIEYQNTHN